MKKIIIFKIFLLSIFSFGQLASHNDYNEISTLNIVSPNNNQQNITNPNFEYSKKVYNIFFHIVGDDSGLSTITELEIMKAVASLNVGYNPLNFFFKYRGTDILPSSNLLNIKSNSFDIGSLPTSSDVVSFSVANNQFVDNSINIFIVDTIYQNILANDGTVSLQSIPGYQFGGANPIVFIEKDYLTTFCSYKKWRTSEPLIFC